MCSESCQWRGLTRLAVITASESSEASQSIGLKALGYAASFAVPFSRVNDNDHYPSQAALGWFMAYESVQTVMEGGQRKATALRLVPIQMAHGQLGLGLQKSW